MGKRLIIKGADFSANAISLENEVLPDIPSDTPSAPVEEELTASFVFTDNLNIVCDKNTDLYGKTNASSKGSSSGFVNIEGVKLLRINMIAYLRNGDGTGGIAFYTNSNESGVIDGHYFRDLTTARDGVADMAERIMSIPNGAKYVRVTVAKAYKSEFYAYATMNE